MKEEGELLSTGKQANGEDCVKTSNAVMISCGRFMKQVKCAAAIVLTSL
jgi:hypothetical protein